MSFTSDNKAAFFNPAIPGVEAAYFRGNLIYVHYSNVKHAFSLHGVNINIGSVLIEAATEDVPDIANGELILIGTAPVVGELTGDEEIIEEGEETEVISTQQEFYVIDHKADGLGSTYIYLSRKKGV